MSRVRPGLQLNSWPASGHDPYQHSPVRSDPSEIMTIAITTKTTDTYA